VEDDQLEGLDMEAHTAIGYGDTVFAMIESIWCSERKLQKLYRKGVRAPRSDIERSLRFRHTLAGQCVQQNPERICQ